MDKQDVVQEVLDDFDRAFSGDRVSESRGTLDASVLAGTTFGGAEVQF